ncbi:alpha/beta fold hydrolase [Amycolatopsis sp. FBCC-B4732]|nr:alpha/beta fold hydrolase [Amycolatopsis sp. FBCC-B4732]
MDLPGTSGDPAAGTHADADAVRAHLAELDGPVTLLAHSYGGVPATEAAGPNVRQLGYHWTRTSHRAGWRDIPSASIVCDDHRSLPGVIIEGGRVRVVRHLPGGHSPILARPAELAAVVDEIAR